MVTPATDGSLLDADVVGAIAALNLDGLPAELLSSLLVDAVRSPSSAGSTIHREDDAAPHIELLVRGLVRVHVTAADGRTLDDPLLPSRCR